MNNFSICIQNLGLYNEGVLAFEWLELPASDEEIAAALDKIKVCHEDLEGNKKCIVTFLAVLMKNII